MLSVPSFSDLSPAVELKTTFRRCHNYIYANQGFVDCDYLFLAADTMRARLLFNAVVHQQELRALTAPRNAVCIDGRCLTVRELPQTSSADPQPGRHALAKKPLATPQISGSRSLCEPFSCSGGR